MALRRHMSGDIDNFPRDVAGWWTGLTPAIPIRMCARYQAWRENPRVVVRLQPLQRATGGQLGLPFAFASHFAPDMLFQGCIFIAATSNRRHDWKNHTRGVHQYYRRRQQPRR